MATLKPTTPLLAPNKGLLKPTSPLRPKTAPKTPISHPQRRWRFQSHAGTSEQRRWRFQLRLSLHEQRRQGFHTTGPPRLRPSSYPQPQCAQNADHLARNTPISPIFTEVVRSLGASLPSTGRLEGAGGTCRGAGGRWRGLAGHTRSTGAAGVEGTGGTCRGAGGRWRGLAGLRDDAPSEARGADGSRAGRRPPAHTAAGPSGARNTREATSNTSGATSNRQPPQAQQSGPDPLGSGPPSMLSGDQRTTRVSSARPPCHPCRSSRR